MPPLRATLYLPKPPPILIIVYRPVAVGVLAGQGVYIDYTSDGDSSLYIYNIIESIGYRKANIAGAYQEIIRPLNKIRLGNTASTAVVIIKIARAQGAIERVLPTIIGVTIDNLTLIAAEPLRSISRPGRMIVPPLYNTQGGQDKIGAGAARDIKL